jgi:hypothetical protein
LAQCPLRRPVGYPTGIIQRWRSSLSRYWVAWDRVVEPLQRRAGLVLGVKGDADGADVWLRIIVVIGTLGERTHTLGIAKETEGPEALSGRMCGSAHSNEARYVLAIAQPVWRNLDRSMRVENATRGKYNSATGRNLARGGAGALDCHPTGGDSVAACRLFPVRRDSAVAGVRNTGIG